jgi:hypothetical protein
MHSVISSRPLDIYVHHNCKNLFTITLSYDIKMLIYPEKIPQTTKEQEMPCVIGINTTFGANLPGRHNEESLLGKITTIEVRK